MFEKVSDPAAVRRAEGHVPLEHRYTPGVAGEQFFAGLKRGELLASRCESCGIVYCPNRIFCERCFSALEAGATVGPGGVLESFTIGYADLEGRPLEEPVTLALVRPEGADTVLLHHVVDADEGLEIGMEVEAVFADEGDRTGSIHDLRGFRPARSSTGR